MKILLEKKPKNVILVEGFPGMGLVGTIATEAVLDYTKAKQIGRIESDKFPALIAVHEGKVTDPLGIFYSKKHNLVIQHAVTNISGEEWKISDSVLEVSKQLNASEIISLEGIGVLGAAGKKSAGAFYYTNDPKAKKKFEKISLNPLKEGIIVGVTGALMLKLKTEKQKMSCIFAETSSGLPDSRAAAKIIEVLDSYLKLKIPFKPLIKKAEQFESKLKNIFAQAKQASVQKQKKERVGYIE